MKLWPIYDIFHRLRSYFMFQTGNFWVLQASAHFSNYGDVSWYNHSWMSYSTNICIWISICCSITKPKRKHQRNLPGIIMTSSMAQSCDDERSLVRLRDSRSVAAGGCGRAQHSWSLIFGKHFFSVLISLVSAFVKTTLFVFSSGRMVFLRLCVSVSVFGINYTGACLSQNCA